MKYQKSLKIITSNILLITSIIFAQGVTTSGLDGFVNDTDNNPLVGANVVVVHEPSGMLSVSFTKPSSPEVVTP